MRPRLSLLFVLLCLLYAHAAPAASAPMTGRFIVEAPRVQSAEWRDEAREMQQSGTLQDLAGALNEIFVLPRDIGILFAECGEPNAYYDPEAHEILMCLELMQGMADALDGQFEDEDTTAEALAGAYIAVVLHEAGHALVHVLEIPVTGREEDAVDQLSAWMLIEADDTESVLGAAATYYSNEDAADDDYADEHSLDKQRYFNLVCWAYGSDPDNRQELIDEWELPEARAENCADEYAQLDRSWSRLLEAHLRDEQAEKTPAPRRDSPRLPPQAPTERDEATFIGTIKLGKPAVTDDDGRDPQPADD